MQATKLGSRFLGTLLIAAPLGLLGATAVALSPAHAAEKTKTEAQTKQVALVKFELRQESGDVVKHDAVVDWDAAGNVTVKADDVVHALDVKVERKGDKTKKASVTLGYSRGGEPVIAPYTFDVKLKKREVIRIEGGLAIAVTVVPKQVAAEPEPEEEEKPAEPPAIQDIEGDDPLAGL